MGGVNLVKDIYKLVYSELPEIPEKPDGLDMFRSCPLLQTSLVQPGGMITHFIWPGVGLTF